jgi:phosphoribosyl 1,2-cyclic phosphodiesterase
MSFKIKFWGVRGSIACPSPRHVAFGGNTSCIEVSLGGNRIIFDAGTGLRNLGHWLKRKNVKHAKIFLSHTHWDHIDGFPFFSPAFRKDNHFLISAGHLMDQGGIQKVISGQMSQPTFPVPLEFMGARLDFEDFRAGDTFSPFSGTRVVTVPLNHPNGATGYRVEHAGKAFCYVTDTEHVVGKSDEKILGLIEGADLVIYDCTYTDKEFPMRVGWGHSTWEEGVRLCRAANAKTLAIFHHDPDHADGFMEKLESEARAMWSGAIVARENMRLNLI